MGPTAVATPAAFVALYPTAPGAFTVDDGLAADQIRLDIGFISEDLDAGIPPEAIAALEAAAASSTGFSATVTGAGIVDGTYVAVHLDSPALTRLAATLAGTVQLDGVFKATMTVGVPGRAADWESMLVQAIAMIGDEVRFESLALQVGNSVAEVAFSDADLDGDETGPDTDNDAETLAEGTEVVWFDGDSCTGTVKAHTGDTVEVLPDDSDETVEVPVDIIARLVYPGMSGQFYVEAQHPRGKVGRWVPKSMGRGSADGPAPSIRRPGGLLKDRSSRTAVGEDGPTPRPGSNPHPPSKIKASEIRRGDHLWADRDNPIGRVTSVNKRWVSKGGHIEVYTEGHSIPWGYLPDETALVGERGPAPAPSKRPPGSLDGLPSRAGRWPRQPRDMTVQNGLIQFIDQAPEPDVDWHMPPDAYGFSTGQFADNGAVVAEVDGVLRWQGPLVAEEVDSGDGRTIAAGALTWRSLPHTLMCMFRNADGGDGHAAAVAVGRIDEMFRPKDRPTEVWGRGIYDAESEDGRNAYRMMKEKFLRGVSVDLCRMKASRVVESGVAKMRVLSAQIMGATQCAFPAFAEAWLEILEPGGALVASSGIPIDARAWSLYDGLQTLVASGGTISPYPVRPPKHWFDKQKFTSFTPVRVSADGQISGHVADWKGCHISFSDRCVPPPRTHCNYAEFRKGEVLCDDGTFVQTGPIVTDTVHPQLKMMASDAQTFYHHTGCVVGDVIAYEDAYGIAIAGAVRPEATEVQVRTLRGGDFSPDWRPVMRRGSRPVTEMCALLTVNNSGFKVPLALVASAGGDCIIPGSGAQAEFDADGELLALVASGTRHDPTQEEMDMDQDQTDQIEALAASVNQMRAATAVSTLHAMFAQADAEEAAAAADREARAAAAAQAVEAALGDEPEPETGALAVDASAALARLGEFAAKAEQAKAETEKASFAAIVESARQDRRNPEGAANRRRAANAMATATAALDAVNTGG